MASNSFGSLLRITTFGESHGSALGVVVDGCPAGIALSEDDFLPELQRRRPSQSDVTSQRNEDDEPFVISGVFEGKTTGMPIAVIVLNKDQKSEHYEKLRGVFRAGHADRVFSEKYGHRDHRGGGRQSGRETVARVLAGVIARKILPENVRIVAHAVQVGSLKAKAFVRDDIEKNPMRCADLEIAKKMQAYVLELKSQHDSVGGLVGMRIENIPRSLGDPVFAKLKSRLADGLMSIGAVTGFSYGAGFGVAAMKGSEYVSDANHAGGILGGISTGDPIVLTFSVKPPSSIGQAAKEGRHDPCIVPRIIPVAEAMAAVVLADAYLLSAATGVSFSR